MYCQVFAVEQTPQGLRVHGQYRRYVFHFDGRLKRRDYERASEWIWYPGPGAYEAFVARNAEVDAMIPSDPNSP